MLEGFHEAMRGTLARMALAAAIGALVGAGVVAIVKQDAPEPPNDPPAELVDSERALELCRTSGVAHGGADAELRAAFESTAGEIADWMLSGPLDAPKGLNQFIEERLRIGPDMEVMVCYFDREEGYYPSLPPGYEGPPINRVRVLVDKDGGSATDALGTQDGPERSGLRLLRPNEGPHSG
jgi:hypothetical protein